MNDIFILSSDEFKAAVADAEARMPEESCGLIVEGVGFVSMKNGASDKINSFAISPKDFDTYKGRIHAIVHSHPDGSAPSPCDRRAQFSVGLPYVILIRKGDKGWSVITLS